ncbi:hypothetical protein SKAU_G00406360 [Synaphobranchus kaupii]|uniref:Uncharacterized protein n=1 Tax=Synaphobranchus kaupii TaxID=118154 RepID=A0A9Q1ICW7_SYNKA|nr:hypothetical protein SKAU_G00406360 [Synaphobranchus kaupii]
MELMKPLRSRFAHAARPVQFGLAPITQAQREFGGVGDSTGNQPLVCNKYSRATMLTASYAIRAFMSK